MEILGEDAFPNGLPIKGGRDTKLRIMLLQVPLNHTLVLPKTEWQRKRPPYKIVAGVKKTHGFIFEYGLNEDGTGWLFRRVK